MEKTISTTLLILCLVLPSTGLAFYHCDFGKAWRGMSKAEKIAYIDGYFEGKSTVIADYSSRVLFHSTNDTLTLDLRKKIHNEFVENSGWGHKNQIEMIIRLLDTFYKDYANIHIPFSNLIELACKKIRNRNIEALLDAERYYSEREFNNFKKLGKCSD